ncbi:hypothetical protein KIH27_05275 [Mycobacterium sp. M1]|uniref:Transmembrane protein n=1 Tax=Mycolicibacter acidiphilus TaxID=2835306 RepID=A0ABS5RJ80_9MYCO|nr:hypothetical protein [Mycolicibacter acidiphilus]MBS9532999.1 hypothetical protein [Mycolicibacter acidiphilus]
MLIVALVLAAVGLAALVFAVVTSNALVAWVCIGASVLGVLLLIVDAVRERRGGGVQRRAADEDEDEDGEDSEDDEAETRVGAEESDDDDDDDSDLDEDDADAADEATETVEAEKAD